MKAPLTLPLSCDIIFYEAYSNYTIVHYRNRLRKVICRTLKAVEQQLPSASYLRIHHKYLVNKEALISIDPKKEFVIVASGVQLSIARRRKNILIKLNNH